MANDSGGQLRRDLEWAVASPFLMRAAGLRTVASVGASPDPTALYSGHRVGHYFESLIEYWLRNQGGLEVLAHGLQVQGDNRTIGELDFVFSDHYGRVRHWEVAVKFYLFCADSQVAGSHFIGPNARDTFERKWGRMQEKQLPLCRHVFPEVSECSAFVKGRIFYHLEQAGPDQLPEGLMPDHLRGRWLRHSELPWLEAASQQHGWGFCVLEKPFWLADLSLGETDAPPIEYGRLRDALDRHFLHGDHPVLISALGRVAGGWEEQERLFVVSDHWPAS